MLIAATAIAAMMAMFALVQWLGRNAIRDADWEKAAAILGLQHRGARAGRSLWGRIGRHSVTVVEANRLGIRGISRLTRIVVGGGIPPGLVIGRTGPWAAITRTLDTDDPAYGELEFAKLVRVEGPVSIALAALTSEARWHATMLLTAEAALVKHGYVELEVHGAVGDTQDIVQLVRSMARLAEALSFGDDDVPGRLAANVRGDAVPAVRRRNLEALTGIFAETSTARGASWAALSDEHLPMRLCAARHLGANGTFDTLVAIASQPTLNEERAEAIGLLAAAFPDERIAPVLDRALLAPFAAVRAAAIRALGAIGDAQRLGAVAATCTLDTDALIGEGIAAALLSLGDPRCTRTLVTLLQHPAASVQRAAIAALSAIGTSEAVEPLLTLGREGLMGVAGASRAAVRQIQARLGGVDRGRLSVAAAAERDGAISAVGGGQLAVVDVPGNVAES